MNPANLCGTGWDIDGICRAHGAPITLKDGLKYHITAEDHEARLARLAAASAANWEQILCATQGPLDGPRCIHCLETPCRCRYTVRWLEAEEELDRQREEEERNPRAQPAFVR